MEYVYEMKTRVEFGAGVIKTVADEAKKLNMQKIMVVSDKGVVKAGLAKVVEDADSIKMSCVQFATVVVIAFPLMFIVDPKLMVQGQNYHYTMPTFDDLCASAIPLLYAGVLSSGIAYTLQIKAQKIINPVIASLILCCESVFAAVCGAIMLQEMMSIREIIGCIIMFLSIAATKLIQLKGDSE